jgi:hypothetical protein
MPTVAEAPDPCDRDRRGHAQRPASSPTRWRPQRRRSACPVVLPGVSGGSLPGLALRHSEVVTFGTYRAVVSIFLHPFAPRALPHFIATMSALTPAGRCKHRLKNRQVSLLTCAKRPTIPPSTTPGRPGVPVWFCSPGLPRAVAPRSDAPPLLGCCVTWASPLASRLATATGRIRFVVLRTSRSPPVALHLASRRRSYFRLRGSDPTSTGTCTPLFRHEHRRTSPAFQGCCTL